MQQKIRQFQHDSCREVLHKNFHESWIGTGGLVNWPARSLDLMSPDIFLWTFLKDNVYSQHHSPQHMMDHISHACATITQDILLNRV